ncbi:diaminohydroxyphosphoribosylaminopyrimidine deaminase [Rhizobium laguerreae]|nr:diaminohydroxyphosphoribosylaminopyrimidine deaminase [Rhizobium laguerreae]NKM18138.1 diaminohydroxyphosphoribosylaminopyrimidine deaminase [Rhizobium laguerreae]NKM40757.1 diaminohydroxyphosphoribosylaminopyrimidine deaminase [Rhizobium laguerreae]TBX79000.1 diaminohydroxyphosphoribosylaminopyrimidine deaminase [Rhizobium laguerreae]TBY06800.1 diaminohydroxyphosphoribosylaminopyrimidine deaminase [Rhizobium laguerreae]
MPCRTPSALPGISPTGGEIGWAHWPPPTMSVQDGETIDGGKVKPLVISPPVGEMPGRAEGGHTVQPFRSRPD